MSMWGDRAMCWQICVCHRKGKPLYLYCKLVLCYVPDGELNSYPSDPVLSLVPTTYIYIYIVSK